MPKTTTLRTIIARDGLPQLPAVGQRAVKRARRKILPLILVLYFVAYLDRNNVGFAKEQLSADIGLTAATFGFGAGLFFLGYTLLEVPSNAAMYRFGARKWISRILITWGIVATLMCLVQGPTSFSVMRAILGAAEAGFFPAVLFYFTLWFPAAQRVAIMGTFVLAQPIANAVGAPLSGWILTLDGVAGLQGWQWLFIIEGVPAILLGIVTPLLLTDRPEQARWMPEDERAWLTETMAAELAAKGSSSARPFLSTLKDPRVFVYAGLNFGMVCGIYGLAFWLPTVVEGLTAAEHLGTVAIGFVVLIPYAVAACFVYWWSQRADRTGRRAWHAAVALCVAAAGLAGAAALSATSPIAAIASLTVAATGIYCAIAPMLSMPSSVFAGAAAAAGIGLVNAVGNIGGFVSPYIVGLIEGTTGSTATALFFLAAVLVVTAAATYLYARHRPEGDIAYSDDLDAINHP